MTQRTLWRTVNSWVPHEWATKKEAWRRVYAALSENIELTRLDLKAHLLAKRLVGAARVIAPDGSERCIIFKPAFWEPVELTFAYMMTGFEKCVSEGEAWHFFVRRRELDQLYPPDAFAPPVDAAQRSERHRPGPKPKDEWPKLMAAKLIHRAVYDPESLRNIDALVPIMKEFLEEEIGWAPKDPKEIRKEIVFLLQFVRR